MYKFVELLNTVPASALMRSRDVIQGKPGEQANQGVAAVVIEINRGQCGQPANCFAKLRRVSVLSKCPDHVLKSGLFGNDTGRKMYRGQTCTTHVLPPLCPCNFCLGTATGVSNKAGKSNHVGAGFANFESCETRILAGQFFRAQREISSCPEGRKCADKYWAA